MAAPADIRPSPIAGQWYPDDPSRLAESIDRYIGDARVPENLGEVVAVIAPHAGHLYSGPVAGHAFAAVRNLPIDLVAVLSPMHYGYHEPLLTSGHSAYATPLGVIPIDDEALLALDERLHGRLGFGLTPIRRDPEHSLEIELPFLQQALKGQDFHLLPVMLRDQNSRTAQGLGQALAEVMQNRRCLLVASSDLSHFYPQRMAEILDKEMLQQVENFDPKGVMRVEEEGKGYACGRAAVAAVLWAARGLGANQVKVLNYATSGDVSGDYQRVVGYGAAVVSRKNIDG